MRTGGIQVALRGSVMAQSRPLTSRNSISRALLVHLLSSGPLIVILGRSDIRSSFVN